MKTLQAIGNISRDNTEKIASTHRIEFKLGQTLAQEREE